jgi:hypothetical protein
LPTDLVGGVTWIWDRDYADFPRPTWAATAYFEKAGAAFSIAATQNGTAQRFTIAAATTAGYAAGRYRIRVRVTDGASVYIAESGWCDVEIDPAAAGTVDPRSWSARTLAAIESFLEGNASSAQASMTIQGRSIARWALQDLLSWRDKLRAEVRTEEGSTASGKGRDIKVRFK